MPKFNRQQAIDELVEQESEKNADSVSALSCGNYLIDDLLDVIEGVIRNGHKGFEQYSNEELQQELKERDSNNA